MNGRPNRRNKAETFSQFSKKTTETFSQFSKRISWPLKFFKTYVIYKEAGFFTEYGIVMQRTCCKDIFSFLIYTSINLSFFPFSVGVEGVERTRFDSYRTRT